MTLASTYNNLKELTVRKIILEIQKKLQEKNISFQIYDTTSLDGNIKLIVDEQTTVVAKQKKFFSDIWDISISLKMLHIVDDDLNPIKQKVFQ